MKPIIFLALLFAVGPLAVSRAQECAPHCDHCGCCCDCCKVCRCVPITKKVPKITYNCKCEDFCVPGRSEHCVVCDECGNKQHVYTPTCATPRTRKVLVKSETMEEKQSYKWVVETLCCKCANQCGAQPVNQSGSAPQAFGPLGSNSQRRDSGAEQANYQADARNALVPIPATDAQASEGGIKAQLRRVFKFE